MSPISSRNSVPPLAYSKRPLRSRSPPVNAPGSWPNSSSSMQVLVEGGAVQRDEGLVLARAVVVDRLGDQLLAGARLAQDQHRGVGRRRSACSRLDHLLHRRAVADRRPRSRTSRRAAASARGWPGPAAAAPPPSATMARSSSQVDRLGEVVGRPLLDGLDGGLHVAVAGDDDHLGVGAAPAGLAEDGQAVQVGHLQVGEDDVAVVASRCSRAPSAPLVATVQS